MSTIEHFDDIRVGIREIDDQHIQAIKLINALLKAKEEKREHEDEIIIIIKRLLEHWKTHFKYEEDLMEQYKYSGSDKHKKEHKNIYEDLSNYGNMLSKGFTYVVSSLAVNLNLWIEEHIKHINGEDKKLAKYLKSKGLT